MGDAHECWGTARFNLFKINWISIISKINQFIANTWHMSSAGLTKSRSKSGILIVPLIPQASCKLTSAWGEGRLLWSRGKKFEVNIQRITFIYLDFSSKHISCMLTRGFFFLQSCFLLITLNAAGRWNCIRSISFPLCWRRESMQTGKNTSS